MQTTVITIEGYTQDEILSFSSENIDEFLLCNTPVVIKIGSAEILCEFRQRENRLIVELAHIDGGGEGILPTLLVFIEQYAKRKGLKQIEWRVYALNCANPNLKLRRIIERKGFVAKQFESGMAYHLLQEL